MIRSSHRHPLTASIALVLCLLVTSALAITNTGPASFTIDWHTIDGGGGTSTGGTFELSGTAGQPDAGAVMTGGSFELTGGFWMGGPAQTCPTDLANNDGLTDVFDLFVVLNNWGTSGPGADLAAPNDVVDVFDLFVLLGAWGACP